MGTGQRVLVFGAYGHTGRFVVAELRDRGFVPVLSGRDADRLRDLAASHEGLEVRPATVDDADALDRALAGAAAVINAAGPFATTAAPLIEAALRAGIPYVDVAAEIEANVDTFARYADRARAEGAVIVPAMAFYGGLGDLLATAALGDWTAADEVHIAYGLSSWHPTAGTRTAGAVSRERRDSRRVLYTDGRLEYRDDQAPTLKWDFPDPMGTRSVIGEFTMADAVTITSHLPVPEVRGYMTVEAVRDLAAADTPAPAPVDDSGRSAQTFLLDVVVRSGAEERRAVARGQDIYAVSAPLAVEAVERILTGRTRATGVASAGELFDADDFLRALSPHISFELL
ncbi:saccharopine dehydrogenase family protein [Streptomyces flavofungini]|uniref:Saccharopine dehydrogenase NADP-binding domain-containing protein n=1 Tax=Streptomyces flavofungini TaxID=68200 RepID=A0ABS0X773_9ACTN|nr:saccharopine dehydrogenase NADP-binding domain-containing protein [Streptomyces flavofungini]MBJ3809055.1 saccharopine dehydrogenase NADP-binding domain-containing protein [Streptomyces flavofungini]GHC68302.1 saccharopine dehydrogenase [Streptomyces flavofungini]